MKSICVFLSYTNILWYRQTHFHEISSLIHACSDQSNLQHVISLKTNFMGMSKIEKIMENEQNINEGTKNNENFLKYTL